MLEHILLAIPWLCCLSKYSSSLSLHYRRVEMEKALSLYGLLGMEDTRVTPALQMAMHPVYIPLPLDLQLVTEDKHIMMSSALAKWQLFL